MNELASFFEVLGAEKWALYLVTGEERDGLIECTYVFGPAAHLSVSGEQLILRLTANRPSLSEPLMVPSGTKIFPDAKLYEEMLESHGWIRFEGSISPEPGSGTFLVHEVKTKGLNDFLSMEELP